MIIPIDAEKAFDKVQHPFLIKTLSKVGIEGAFLIIIKAFMRDLQSTSYSKDKNLELSHYDQEQDKDALSPLLFNIVLEVLATAIKQEKEIKGIQMEMMK